MNFPTRARAAIITTQKFDIKFYTGPRVYDISRLKNPQKIFFPQQSPDTRKNLPPKVSHTTLHEETKVIHNIPLCVFGYIIRRITRAPVRQILSSLYSFAFFSVCYAAGKIVISFYYFKKKKKKVRFLLLYIRHFSLFDQSGPCAVAPGVCVYILPPLFYIVGVVLIFVSVMDVYSVRRVNIINGG